MLPEHVVDKLKYFNSYTYIVENGNGLAGQFNGALFSRGGLGKLQSEGAPGQILNALRIFQ